MQRYTTRLMMLLLGVGAMIQLSAGPARAQVGTGVPCNGATPCFESNNDILSGQRHLMRNDDLVVTIATISDGHGNTPIDNYILKTSSGSVSSQTTETVLVKTDCPFVPPSPPPAHTRVGRLFPLPYDVIVTLAPSVNSVDDCTATTIPNLAFHITDTTNGGNNSTTNLMAQSDWVQLALGDFNRDGTQDVFFINRQVAQAYTASDLSNSSAGLRAAGKGLTLTNPQVPMSDPVVGDFNGDGVLDVAWPGANATPGGTIVIYFASVCPGPNVQVMGQTCAAAFDIILSTQTINNGRPLGQPDRFFTPSVALVADDFDGLVNPISGTPDAELAVSYYSRTDDVLDVMWYKFDSSMVATAKGSISDSSVRSIFTPMIASGRLEWLLPQAQLVFAIANSNRSHYVVTVLTFDANLNAQVRTTSEDASNVTVLGVAVGRFDPPDSSAGNPNLNQQIAVLRTSGGANPHTLLDIWTVDPPSSFVPTLSNQHTVDDSKWLITSGFNDQNNNNVLPDGVLQVGDLQGRSLLLGTPEVVRISSQTQPTVILGDPPKHVDYVSPDLDQAPTVVNFSATTALNSRFDLASSQETSSSNTTTSSFSWADKESIQDKFSVGVPLVDRIQGDFKQTFQETGSNTTTKTNSQYQRLSFGASETTSLSDLVIGTTMNQNIYVYPVLGQTVCPASIAPNGATLSCDLNSGGGCTCSPTGTAASCAGIADNPPQTTCDAAGDCCNTPQVPLHVQYSAPDTITNFSYAADATANVEWYQPVYEPLNVLSYPWTLAQVQAQVDTGVAPLASANTFGMDSVAKSYPVSWTTGGTTGQSVGSTSSFSFETSDSLTVGTPKIDTLATGSGFQQTLSYSYNSSKAHSSLNTNQMTLTESLGVTVTAPGFTQADHVSLYSYGVSPEIFLQAPSPGVIQDLSPGCGKDGKSLCDLPVSGLGAGSLRVQHSVDITQGGSWWSTGPYSAGNGLPDLALNHPARWTFVSGGQGPACVSRVTLAGLTGTDCVRSIPPTSAADLKDDSRLLWSSEWHFMRGLFVTVDTPQGPQRDTATAGDTVYLRARVYNFSQKAMPTNTQVHVQFYRQKIDPSTYALLGNSVLIEDVLLKPIPPHSNPVGNPGDLPNWLFAETSFDTTAVAPDGPTSWLFWVVTWGEQDGSIMEEVAGHGLDLSTPPTQRYTSIADVPLQSVTVTDPASGNPMTTSFTNNVGFYHKLFTILPTTVALALPAPARAPELRVCDLRARPDVNAAGHPRLLIEAEVLSLGDHTNGVVVRFYEGDPGKTFDKPAFDEETLGYLRPGIPHRVQIPYRPQGSGRREIVMVAAPGQRTEARSSVVVRIPWSWPSSTGVHGKKCEE